MKSHADVVSAFGGPTAIARALGLEVATTLKWGGRGIPAKYWPRLEESERGRELGLTAVALSKLTQPTNKAA